MFSVSGGKVVQTNEKLKGNMCYQLRAREDTQSGSNVRKQWFRGDGGTMEALP